jgi:hypothetical protein
MAQPDRTIRQAQPGRPARQAQPFRGQAAVKENGQKMSRDQAGKY